MVTLSEKEVERLLVVASAKQRTRMGNLLGVGADSFFVCASVFDAVAEVVLGREGGSIVLVTVDNLDRQEMGVFSTLAKLEGAASIGVTGLQEPNRKLQEALDLGADGVCSLADDSGRLGELIQRFIRKQSGTVVSGSAVIEVAKERESGQGRLKAISPLSDEELSALLG